MRARLPLMLLWMAGGPALLGAVETPPPVALPGLSAEALAKLEKDETVVLKSDAKREGDQAKGGGTVLVMVKQPAEAVWRHLTDFEVYPEYMPRVAETKTYLRDGNTVGVYFELKILWKRITYHVLHTLNAETHTITWQLDPAKKNDIVESIGQFVLTPHGENRCILSYNLTVDTGMHVPGFVEDFLLRKDLPNVPKAVKKQAESGGEYKK